MEGFNARAAAVSLTQPLHRCWGLAAGTFQRHPFLVKTLSSGVGFAFGDGITQVAMRRKNDAYDWRRTAAMGVAGLAAAGPLGYGFIIWMEGKVMTSAPTSRLAIATKVTLDQVVGAMLWQLAALSISEQYRGVAVDLWGQLHEKEKKKPASAALKVAR